MKRGFRNLPLGQKLAVALAVTGGVTLFLACGAFVWVELALFKRELIDTQTIGARVLAANSTAALAFENHEDASEVLDALRAERRVRAAALYAPDGRVFARYPAGLALENLPPTPEPDGHRFTPDALLVFQPVVQGQRRLGTLFIETDLTAIRERLLLYVWITILVIAGATVVGALIAARLRRIILEPIFALADSARAVTERGDFLVRTEPQGDDEVGELTKAFNAMLANIHASGAALRESEDRFRTMANSMAQLAWIAKADGHIYWYNQRWYEYTGSTPELMEGWGWRMVHDPDRVDEVSEKWRKSIESGVAFEAEFPLRGGDGHYRRFLTRAVPLKGADGKVMQWFGTNTDVEQLRLAEEQVRQLNDELEHRVAERTTELEVVNKELEAFSYSVSHDLRAPLRHIAGYVNLLDESAGELLPPENRRYLGTIASSARQMGQLIDDLLVFSRMGRGQLKRQPVDLNVLVDETVAGLVHDFAGRNIVWRRTTLPEVHGDRQMLRQVLVNLIANAIKYTRPRDPAEIEIGGEAGPDGGVVVYVRDNGVGFDMDYAGKLFGVFQRLHSDEEFEGTGIGLANVRRIIARHGGRTWAEARVDAGATFYLSLPPSTSASP